MSGLMGEIQEDLMRCPTLEELPPPPAGKTGWPWTVHCAQLPGIARNGQTRPRITIVTPSYNQGEFIEETIRSVLLQGYPDVEYMVMDGGSTDRSVDIIRKYEPWLAYWVSESDQGQAHGINKGLDRATGKIFQFINSDDILQSGALEAVFLGFEGFDAVAGNVLNFSEHNSYIKPNRGLTPERLIKEMRDWGYCCFHQPGIWLLTDNIKCLAGYQLQFRYCFDLLLFVQYLEKWPNVRYLPDVLVHFRLHDGSKSVGENDHFIFEDAEVRRELSRCLSSSELRRLSASVARKLDWRETVKHLLEPSCRGALQRFLKLIFLSLASPAERIDRFSAGAARRLMLRGLRELFVQ
jgi:glycosyltransferase involved in cell wall biosynthesis